MESSDGLPEIFPTIEGLTKKDLEDAGIPCDLDSGDNGNLDEIAGAEQITDSGVADENGEIGKSDFIITLKDIGFDINDYHNLNLRFHLRMECWEVVSFLLVQ